MHLSTFMMFKPFNSLWYYTIVTPYGDKDLGQHREFGSGNGLLPDSTKPLPEPILTKGSPEYAYTLMEEMLYKFPWNMVWYYGYY